MKVCDLFFPLAYLIANVKASIASIRTAAQTVVNDLLYYYTGDQPGGTPGQLPYPVSLVQAS